jgi:hypothetical protein
MASTVSPGLPNESPSNASDLHGGAENLRRAIASVALVIMFGLACAVKIAASRAITCDERTHAAHTPEAHDDGRLAGR